MRGLLRLLYQDNMFGATIEWRLAASQERIAAGETPTAGYGILNIGVGVRLLQGEIVHNISLHCDNLLDKVYRDHTSVIKDFLPQPARGVRLNYDMIF